MSGGVVPAKCGPFNLAGIADHVRLAERGDEWQARGLTSFAKLVRAKRPQVYEALVVELAQYAGEALAASFVSFTTPAPKDRLQ